MVRKKTIFWDLAYSESLKSPMSKKHGAVLVKRGKVVSTGYNKYQNRAMQNFSWREENEPRLRKLFDREGGGDIYAYKQFTDKMWSRSACSVHAEMMAILNAGMSPARGCTLYVIRCGGVGQQEILPSDPCPKCTKACERLNIRVFHS